LTAGILRTLSIIKIKLNNDAWNALSVGLAKSETLAKL